MYECLYVSAVSSPPV